MKGQDSKKDEEKEKETQESEDSWGPKLQAHAEIVKVQNHG